jgi:hypothetical protein
LRKPRGGLTCASHRRVAPQLAAAGILIPEGLQANGADIKGGVWFETGAEMLNGGTLNYFAVPWGIVSNPLPLFLVIAIEVGLMGAVEFYRRNGTGPAGFSPGASKRSSRTRAPGSQPRTQLRALRSLA